jgi:hypothetical protein
MRCVGSAELIYRSPMASDCSGTENIRLPTRTGLHFWIPLREMEPTGPCHFYARLADSYGISLGPTTQAIKGVYGHLCVALILFVFPLSLMGSVIIDCCERTDSLLPVASVACYGKVPSSVVPRRLYVPPSGTVLGLACGSSWPATKTLEPREEQDNLSHVTCARACFHMNRSHVYTQKGTCK